MNANDLFAAGRLADAIGLLSRELRTQPTDLGRRYFLAELLCFAGDWERADRQLAALVRQDPATLPGVALFRQLLRAETARQQFFAGSGLPQFRSAPAELLQCYLRAAVLLREGREAEAGVLLAGAEAQRPHPGGTCDGRPCDDLRDLDDLTAAVFEVLTAGGGYYWIAMAEVAAVDFQPPREARSLLWRQAQITFRDAAEPGNVYLPALYPLTAGADEAARLGRRTDWRGAAVVRGVGQRLYLAGEEPVPILEIRQLRLHW
ncbi:MAG: tetratricopeptide repeat protein [Pseudomonadota bacterium]|nr:tetratricopeptide repeat protein [Pseudomonadota bacterium]